MDFLRPGLKTGVGNGIFWSEIGSGFGDTGGITIFFVNLHPTPGEGVNANNSQDNCDTSETIPIRY